jgi:general secretion pathway protein M
MRAWWDSLQPRERRTLGLGAVAATVILYYALLWLPPQQNIAELRERIANTRTDLAWMEQAAVEIAALRRASGDAGATPRTDRALYAVADQSAREAGLGDAIERVEPAGERQVRVVLGDAAFDAMVLWLADLRRRHGLTVETASIEPSGESGRVRAQLLLSGAPS